VSTVVWYFAYGSNMQSATLRGRRGIAYRRSVAVRVRGWRLVLDKPGLIAPDRQTFANIVPEATAYVLGVCFEMSADDLAHVELTEGVKIENYRRVMVAVEPLAEMPDPPREAATLTSDRRADAARPTTRYMEIVIDGAVEHGLPPEWVAQLRTVSTIPEDAQSLAFRNALDQVMRRPGGSSA